MDREGASGFSIKPGGGGGGRGGNKCGRWNPTAEQVKVLTDLFRSGLRTPSTNQIQKISSQLSIYGKIESKNVFYWFQNHKARERQKQRRVFDSHDQQNEFHCEEKISSTKNFAEITHEIPEPERAMETLELFPLKSFCDSESERLRLLDNEYKEKSSDPLVYALGREISGDHVPLDLRLSFL